MYDLLSIMVSRISVNLIAKKSSVVVPNSGLIKRSLLKIYSLGYISGFKIVGKDSIIVFLKYTENKPVIRRIVRISTPGGRIYRHVRSMRNGFGGNFNGFTILSTNRGLLTDQECLFYNVGGEPLFLVS